MRRFESRLLSARACCASGLLALALSAPGAATADTLLFEPNEIVAASEASGSNSSPTVEFTPDGVAHLVWILGALGSQQVVVAEAPPGGPYGTSRELSSGEPYIAGGEFRGPTLQVTGDTIAAGWKNTLDVADPAIWAARSIDQGVNWEPAVRADPVGGITADEFLDFQAIGLFPDGRMAQVWMITDRILGQTRYVWSGQDGLGDFSPPVTASAVVAGQPCECCYPDQILLEDGTTSLVAYRGNIANLRDIHLVRSIDGGASFPQRVDVDDSGWVIPACPASGPSLAADGATVLATWMSGAGGEQHAWLARSEDGGETWTPKVQLDDTDGRQAVNYPQVTMSGDLAVVAWEGRLGGGGYGIHAAVSGDRGLTWSAPVLVSDAPSARKATPSVALSADGVVEVAWVDHRLGPPRIARSRGAVLPEAAPFVLREALSDPLDQVGALLPFLLSAPMTQYAGLFGGSLPWTDPEPVLSPASDKTIVFYRFDDPAVPTILVEADAASESIRLVAGP